MEWYNLLIGIWCAALVIVAITKKSVTANDFIYGLIIGLIFGIVGGLIARGYESIYALAFASCVIASLGMLAIVIVAISKKT